MEFSLLEDEKFDFDLSLSPEEQRDVEDDDEEIFFGPIGHKERCIATNADTEAIRILDKIEKHKPLSPLNADEVVEIFNEATSVALMFKSCSSEDGDHKNDFPELINDINNKATRISRDDNDENFTETKETEMSTSREAVDQGMDRDEFVVRRRALTERNVETSKLQRLMQKSNPSSQTYGINESTEKRITVTPGRKSFSTSKQDRNKSTSDKSDTSFSEENKQSKLPTGSHCGLKPPGFSSSQQRRSSSNSSISSTSSTSSVPNVSLNETFTVPKPSETRCKNSNIKQPSGTKSKPSTKGVLTKSITSKPVFSKPNEAAKGGKLQPMKAVAAVSTRCLSNSDVKSPVIHKNTRSASMGTTPLSSFKVDKIPAKGSTPVRRRFPNVSSTLNTTAKPRPNSFAKTSVVSERAVTPLQRRSISRIPGFGRGKPGSSVSSGVAAKRPGSTVKNSEKIPIKLPSTPENRAKKAQNTSDKAETPEPKTRPPTSAKKRRSLLPTPNLNKKAEMKKYQTASPVAFNLSPKVSTSKKAKPAVKKLNKLNIESENNIEGSISDNISSDTLAVKLLPVSPDLNHSVNGSAKVDCEPDFESMEKTRPTSSERTLSDSLDENDSSDLVGAVDGHGADLMIQLTSPTVENAMGSVSVDPFSPGIDSPDLPIDGCLNPIVVAVESRDLIDLSYASPQQEVDLIDLAAKSPLVEARLVDI